LAPNLKTTTGTGIHMLHPGLNKLLSLIALLFGAVCSTALMVFDGGGMIQGAPGYAAWAFLPYAVLLMIFFVSGWSRIHPPVQRAQRWAIIVVALVGPLLYFDTRFIHVDAQGALAMLTVPVIQMGLGLFASVASLVWQWRINRAIVLSRQTGRENTLNTSVPASVSQLIPPLLSILKKILIASFIIYTLISILQISDSQTIDTAKEVDFFITQYCKANKQLPTTTKLRERFPGLSTDNGWFYFTDDKTWLKVQYPVKWRNSNAIGVPKTSEFTATIYSYNLEYSCENVK